MVDKTSMIAWILYGLACFWIGFRAGKAETGFQPTQETWLELEKFRWTHMMDYESDKDGST